MNVRFWRSKPAPPPPQTPNAAPAWAFQSTRALPTVTPGRAGNLTPAQEWRANGGRW